KGHPEGDGAHPQGSDAVVVGLAVSGWLRLSVGAELGRHRILDTVEIVAFLARHPQFRPAPMSQLATAYYVAWRWLRRDFQDNKHVLSVFAFGRGNYSYIN